MILIGMYDSPFVRRVAIALRLYGMSFEHRNWSVFRDADLIAPYNPLIRVPTLVLDDGEVLIESAAILDALDEMVGPEAALIPAGGPQRRLAQKLSALALGVGDKTVSLIYENRVHGRATPAWVERCRRQIVAALNLLEADREAQQHVWRFGERMSHADIAIACVLRLAGETIGDVIDIRGWPRLAAHCERCEATEVFADFSQPFFTPPASPSANS